MANKNTKENKTLNTVEPAAFTDFSPTQFLYPIFVHNDKKWKDPRRVKIILSQYHLFIMSIYSLFILFQIQRTLAYQATSKDVSKWDEIVNSNRKAEHLSFPLNQDVVRLQTTDSFVKKFKVFFKVSEIFNCYYFSWSLFYR